MNENKWYKEEQENSVAFSTRIRLARNLVGYPFPHTANTEDKNKIINLVHNAIMKSDIAKENNLKQLDLTKLSDADMYSLVEKHLISPGFVNDRKGKSVIISDDEKISIMINEEDHIRIQILSTNLDFENSLRIANNIDDVFDRNLEYAFSDTLGFLTQCPTNLGTGLRASVMLHLPALEMGRYIDRLNSTISKLGLTIRGTFGEGSDVKGSFYQISNQVTLGISEEVAIENLKSIVDQIIAQEENARIQMFGDKDVIIDKVKRAAATLKNAHILSSDELINLSSIVRLGIAMGIIDDISVKALNILMFEMGSAAIMAKYKKTLDPRERDLIRAKIAKEMLM